MSWSMAKNHKDHVKNQNRQESMEKIVERKNRQPGFGRDF